MHHAKNHQANNISNITTYWRGGPQNKNKVDKGYLEKAVQIALSLAVQLEQQSKPLIQVRDIVMENIVVVDTKDGATDFIKMSNTDTDSWYSPRNQRLEICALGRIFYEMFTLGSPPSKPASNSSNSNTATSTSSTVFGNALRINIDDEECENNEDDDYQSRPQRRRRDDDGRGQSISTQLEVKGLPSSICRLVTDMLENENVNNELEWLFCNDQAIPTFELLVCDLRQMSDLPKSFLHDSLRMRWKPAIANKLYCRDVELQQAIAVAGRVSQSENELEEFGDIKAHQVLMVSGHSG